MLSVSIQPTLISYAVSMPIQFMLKTYKNLCYGAELGHLWFSSIWLVLLNNKVSVLILNFDIDGSKLRNFGKGDREAGQRDQLYRLARLVGRVTGNPLVSVTIDVLMARGDVHPQARWVKSQDRIAQRPVMARWNRLAGSIYKLEVLWDLMLLKGARPFHIKLYLICFNNKCFDFKPIFF